MRKLLLLGLIATNISINYAAERGYVGKIANLGLSAAILIFNISYVYGYVNGCKDAYKEIRDQNRKWDDSYRLASYIENEVLAYQRYIIYNVHNPRLKTIKYKIKKIHAEFKLRYNTEVLEKIKEKLVPEHHDKIKNVISCISKIVEPIVISSYKPKYENVIYLKHIRHRDTEEELCRAQELAQKPLIILKDVLTEDVSKIKKDVSKIKKCISGLLKIKAQQEVYKKKCIRLSSPRVMFKHHYTIAHKDQKYHPNLSVINKNISEAEVLLNRLEARSSTYRKYISDIESKKQDKLCENTIVDAL